jgi:CheY-like chemotaxis protein
VRRFVSGQVAGLGYRVLEAVNGEAALSILDGSDDAVDLLFSDVIMAGKMDGYALARAARARRPGLKVLLTSGYPRRPTGPGGEPGAELPLLAKPYRQADLALALRKALTPT